MPLSLADNNRKRWQDAVGWRGYLRDGASLRLEERVKEVARLLEPADGGSYLDIGCSDGVLTAYYAKRLGKVDIHGIEIGDAQKALQNGVKVARVDLNSSPVPYPDSSFDCVTMCETLEHLIDPEFALGEVRRVLKKDGYAIISVPRLDSKLVIAFLILGFQPHGVECSLRARYGGLYGGEPSNHVSYFTKRALHSMLQKTGFVIETSSEKSMSSGWFLAQKARGQTVGFFPKVAWFLYDMIPFHRDMLIVKIRKR